MADPNPIRTFQRHSRIGWPIYLVLVLAVLVPRLWQISYFLTPDEILFLDHARQFVSGIVSGDWSLTLGIGYPGVTLAWVGGLGLLVLYGLSRLGLAPVAAPGTSLEQFLAGVDLQPLPYYTAGRIAQVLLVAGLAVVFFYLVRRVFSSKQEGDESADAIALVSTLLLALDPFVLGYSRLMHIAAPLALLMLLTVLAWLIWLRQERSQHVWGGAGYLALSGVLCGLSVLTKSTAVLLYPMLLALGVVVWLLERPIERPSSRDFVAPVARLILGWLVVLVVSILVIVALWPAVWDDPGTALDQTFGKLLVDREAGQGNLGMFWMGRFVEDPGLAFYPVVWLLKSSPLVVLGMVINLGWLMSRREPTSRRDRSPYWAVWLYGLWYLLVMSLASKKSVRYLLPATVAFIPLAAYGLIRIQGWILKHLPSKINYRPVIWLGLVILLAALALPYAPHYLSYYNPLVLGWCWAPRTILVGWGEGLSDAARYLNRQPGVSQASVTAWYDWTFAPYFVGTSLPFSTQEALQADYSVFYVNQVQRNIPDPNLITYFQRRQPEHVVRLNGVDYAWIYPAISSEGPLPENATQVNVSMGDRVVLEGYVVRPGRDSADGLIVTLYWRVLQDDLADYFVYVRAVDDTGQIIARSDSPPVMGFWPTSRWQAGRLVADEQVLVRPAETQAGTYRLEVGMYDPGTWEVLAPAGGERGAGGGLLLGDVYLP